MHRVALTILVYCLLGVLTSVAVAWVLALVDQARQQRTFHVQFSDWDGYGIEVNRGRVVTNARDQSTEFRLLENGLDHAGLPWWSALHDAPTEEDHIAFEYAAGWPLHCLRFVIRADHQPWLPLMLYEAEGALEGSIPLSVLHRTWRDPYRLPAQPIWGNILLNGLILGAAWLVVLRVGAIWRMNRWIRWRLKRRCGWCGYDMAHAPSDVCPECGHHRVESATRMFLGSIRAPVCAIVSLAAGIVGLVAYQESRPRLPAVFPALLGADSQALGDLLQAGADPNVMVNRGDHPTLRPLAIALRLTDFESAELLIEHGAQPSLVSPTEWLPASEEDRLKALDFLISIGVDPMTTGYNPLLDAVLEENVARMKELLARGHSPNTPDGSTGRRPLHLASAELARVLLESGADPNVFDFTGETPLSRAVAAEDADRIALLLDHGALADWQSLVVAAQRGDVPMLRILDAAGGDIAASGASLLYSLCWHPDNGPPSWALIVELGADPNALPPGAAGYTPLMHWVEVDYDDIVQFLLDHGADPTAQTVDGTTAFDLARSEETREMLRQAIAAWEAKHEDRDQ